MSDTVNSKRENGEETTELGASVEDLLSGLEEM